MSDIPLSPEEKHVDDALLTRVITRDASLVELQSLQAHFTRCAACAARAEARAATSLRSLRESFTEVPEPLEHPLDELEPYVSGGLNAAARELVESHLEECPDCTAKVTRFRQKKRVALRARWLAIAAAAVIFVVTLTAIWRSRDVAPPVVPRKAITHVPPAPAETPAPPTQTAERAPEIARHYSNAEWDALVRDARESGRLALPATLADLRRDRDDVRGSAEELTTVSPTGIVIDDVRPSFSWPKRNGATYVVFVFDGDKEIAHSPVLQQHRWTADRELPRNRTLAWQVEATQGEAIETIPRPPSPPALFRIASANDHRALMRARDEYPQDHLLHGLLYARAGMIAEATASLQRAAKSDPAARTLLDRLNSP